MLFEITAWWISNTCFYLIYILLFNYVEENIFFNLLTFENPRGGKMWWKVMLRCDMTTEQKLNWSKKNNPVFLFKI